MINIGINEVKVYLSDVKTLVKKKQYVIPKRDSYLELLDKYYVDDILVEDIVMKLTYKDFSCANYNEHPEYKDEILYIFGKDVRLVSHSSYKEELVPLYIKFNKIDDQFMIIVSFHEQKYKLKYKFK